MSLILIFSSTKTEQHSGVVTKSLYTKLHFLNSNTRRVSRGFGNYVSDYVSNYIVRRVTAFEKEGVLYMDDLGIRPPTAPGSKSKTTGGFFSKLFKKNEEDVQDARITEDHLNTQFDIDNIRKQVGIDTEADNAPLEAPLADVPVEDLSPDNKSTISDDDQFTTPDEQVATADKQDITSNDQFNTSDDQFDNPPSPVKMPDPFEEDTPAMAPEAEPEAVVDEIEPFNIEEELTPPPRIDKEWLDSTQEEKYEKEASASEDNIAWGDEESREESHDESAWSEKNLIENTISESPVEEFPKPSEAIDSPFSLTPVGEPEETVDNLESDDLEDIKRLHEELLTQEKPILDSFQNKEESNTDAPSTHEWASDKSIALEHENKLEHEKKQDTNEFMKPQHEPIEAVMVEIGKKHKKLDDELAKVKEILETELPDWKLQKKEVTPEHHFTLKNGQKLTSFRDLLEALSFIDDETYNYHVTEDRNDFAEWVEHILEEEKLAEKIRNKKAREELLKILRLHEEKIHANLQTKQKAFDKEIEKRKDKTKTIRKLEKKLGELAKELEQKSADLRKMRGDRGKQLKEHIDAHIEDRIGEARAELHLKSAEIEGRARALDEQDRAIDDRHDVLKNIEKTHKKELANLEQQRARFEAEMRDAHEIVAEADKIHAEKEEALAARKEAKTALQEQQKLVNAALKAEKAEQAAKKRAESAQKKLAKDKKAFLQEKKSVSNLKKELDKREKALNKKEQEAKKAVETMVAERETFTKERNELKVFKKQEMSSLDARRKEVESLIKEVESRTEEYRDVVKKNESTLNKNQGVLDEIQRLRDDIKRREQDSEKRSMKAYLQSKLDETVTDGLTSSPMPRVDDVSNVKLYRLIDDCKNALDGNDIVKARTLYNQLRTEFSTTKLSNHEKSVLYNSIRELYDDIHLSMLNQ